MRVLAAFDWSVIWDSRDELWDGFKLTMKAGVLGIVAAYLIGLVLGAVRAHRIPLLSQLAAIYVEVIRNTPILVQMFFLYYGPPELGIQIELFTLAWLSLTIWGGAFMTENFRAGFEAVPARLREAGYALGFGPVKNFLNVTLPIGGRIALPSSINTCISVLKNTSLLFIIRLRRADLRRQQHPVEHVPGVRDVHGPGGRVPRHRLDALGPHPVPRAAARAAGGVLDARAARLVPPVAEYMLREGLPETLRLAAISVTASLVVGILLGTLMTIRFRPTAVADPVLHRGLARPADPRHRPLHLLAPGLRRRAGSTSSSTPTCPRPSRCRSGAALR